MPTTARTIGGPGSGKTRRAIEILTKCLEKAVRNPFKIGFTSFTRAARRTASERAAALFENISASELEKEGWFRTMHSCCHRLLGIQKGEMLVGDKDGNTWLKDALGDDSASLGGKDVNDDYLSLPSARGVVGQSLAIWDAARNSLSSFESIHDRLLNLDDRMADLDDCVEVIHAYEEAKRRDGRLDFTDLLLRFAGRQYDLDGERVREVAPKGDVPDLKVWLHDEAQDMSPLTALVFKRLIAPAEFCYLLGDDWQAIFSWAGTDGSIFGDWPVVREEVLPLSHRCPTKILARAHSIIHRSYAPRAFTSAEVGGEIAEEDLDDALARLKPSDDVLILARTNEYLREIAAELDEAFLPWKPLKGGGGANAPVAAKRIAAIINLECGMQATGEDIARVLDTLPSKADGVEFFKRGMKKRFGDEEWRASIRTDIHGLREYGATAEACELIFSGRYKELLDPLETKLHGIIMHHGAESLDNPSIRAGTIHSAKGLEASHVILVNRIPWPVQQAIEERSGLDEERRVWYVACSRAKTKLTIAETDGEPFPEL
jgi:DNA helicase-2/ATP-dependent DNA helicase PcrA